MSSYVPSFRGYVADVPEVWFKRIDGEMFHFDEITKASVTPDVQFTEVNAGWSLYPVAYLPAASKMEMQLTSGQFDSSMFSMANGGKFEANETFKLPVTEQITVKTGLTAELSSTEAVSDIIINGLIATESTPTAGYFKYAATGNGPVVTTITFAADDVAVGDVIDVTYYVNKKNALSLDVDNAQAAIGEAVLKWPVYNGGENVSASAFNGAAIKGHVIMRIYKCRVTQMPGFDTSYKSAATNAITLATMDPKNTNGKAYTMTYVENK